VVNVYEDPAVSGAEEDRPAMWAAVDTLRRGWGLVVWRFDRLSRNVNLWGVLERHAAKVGAVMISASGEKNITAALDPAEELHWHILKAFMAYERRIIALRTSAAMLRRQREGQSMSSQTPFGWEFDPKRRRPTLRHANGRYLQPCAREQEVLARIMAMHQAGLNAGEIARELAAAGAPCRKGEWGYTKVARIIRRAAPNP
jgi:DNA invertase Pin-like site-specific DNA recombinase